MGGGTELPPHTHSWTNRNYNEVHSGEKKVLNFTPRSRCQKKAPLKQLAKSKLASLPLSATAVRAQSVGVPLIDGRGTPPSIPVLSLSSPCHPSSTLSSPD